MTIGVSASVVPPGDAESAMNALWPLMLRNEYYVGAGKQRNDQN